MQDDKINDFSKRLALVVKNKELIKLLLSNKRDKTSDLKNIIATIVSLKKGYCLNFVYRHNTKDITKNYSEQEGLDLIRQALENDFYNAEVYSSTEDIKMMIMPNGKIQLKSNAPTLQSKADFSHDKVKDKLISTANNIYLRELGIVNANWEVRREMNDKYKQINKYIELLEPYLNDKLLSDNCRIADMGAGKGYLTFALYDYIQNTLRKKVEITGVEYRKDLVDTCNLIAKKSHFDNLNFVQGTIEKTELDRIDILIALHACDTATDEAIYRGIKAKSSLIVCAPCCHKQIRREFNVSSPLNNITKYGILKERQAEIITDSIRALLMEAFGYKTNVFEFISTEHTPKNVMIIGEKTKENPNKQQILDDISAIKEIYGIKLHYLEFLLTKF
jgi:SAM-dependent methyltransferase